MKTMVKPLVITALVTALVVLAAFLAIKFIPKEKTCEYVLTTVTEKRIEDGYGSVFYGKDTQYIVVSVYEGHTVSTVVDMAFYDSVNVGDKIKYCVVHNKLAYYEN